MWQKLSPREQKLLMALAFVLFCTLIIRVVLLGQLPRLLELQAEVGQKKAELANYQSLAENLPNLLNRKEQAEQELQNLEVRFQTNLQSGLPLVQLGENSKNIQLLGVYPQDIVEKPEYLVLPLQMKIRGEYLSILEYMQDLENLPSVTEITYPNLAAAGQKGLVTAEFTLNLFSTKKAEIAALNGQWRLGKFDVFSPALQGPVQEDNGAKPAGDSRQNIKPDRENVEPLPAPEPTDDDNWPSKGVLSKKEPGINYDFPAR